MILLSTTTESLTLDRVTGGVLDYTIYYADHTTTTFTPNSAQGSVSSIGSTTILSAPAASTQRQVKTVIVTNRDGSPTAQTVFIKKISGDTPTHYILTANVKLGSGESLMYSDNRGFEILDHIQQSKYDTTIVAPRGKIEPHRGFSSVGTTRLLANNQGWMMYAGQAPRNGVTSVSIRYRVTSAITAGLFAEIGVYVGRAHMGPTNQGGGSSAGNQMVCVGYESFLTNAGTIGNYTTTVNVGHPGIREGEDVFICFINEFTTAGVTLRSNVGDDLYIGMGGPTSASLQRRPSQDLGWGYLSHLGNGSLLPAPFFTFQWN